VPLVEGDNISTQSIDDSAAEFLDKQIHALSRMCEEVMFGVVRDAATGLYRIRTAADGVCGGILGLNYTGEGGATLEALPSAPSHNNVIAVDYVATGSPVDSGMTLDKLSKMRSQFTKLAYYNDSDIVVAISPLQHEELSRDFDLPCLSEGKTNNRTHCKFFITNKLPLDDKGHRLCVAWCKSKVKFGIKIDATFSKEACSGYVDLQEQLTIRASCGATRLDPSAVLLMPCAENTKYISA